MKRDMDLVRELLLKIAEADEPLNFGALVPDREEGTQEYAFAAYHMKMLIEEAGFVRGIDNCSDDGDDWLSLELTWAGQDFLENIRDPAVWKKTKEGLRKIGGASWDIVADLSKTYLKAKIKERLGLELTPGTGSPSSRSWSAHFSAPSLSSTIWALAANGS